MVETRSSKNAKKTEINILRGGADSEGLISLLFKKYKLNKYIYPRVALRVIIKSSAQFNEEIRELCFPYTCVEKIFSLFCF